MSTNNAKDLNPTEKCASYVMFVGGGGGLGGTFGGRLGGGGLCGGGLGGGQGNKRYFKY